MFGRQNSPEISEPSQSSKGMEIMAKSLLKGLGIDPVFFMGKIQEVIGYVREIRDNSAAARAASEQTLAMLQAQQKVLTHDNGNSTGGRKRGGHSADPGHADG